MILKPQGLGTHLRSPLAAVYLLTGPEHYFLNDAALQIKTAWRQTHTVDENTFDITKTNDWDTLFQTTQHGSLFAERVLLDARYPKKTLEAEGLRQLKTYLTKPNPRCLLILRAPWLSNKPITALSTHPQLIQMHFFPITPHALSQWIVKRLREHGLHYDAEVPALIHQYTQNNLLACNQVIEKLVLLSEKNGLITREQVLPHLADQSEFSLYEFIDACLAGKSTDALHMLNQLRQDRAEPTLLLWMLTQEIRRLITLSHSLKTTTLQQSCQQQKIWPQRISLYEQALKRLSMKHLYALLQQAQKLDEDLKSTQQPHVWHAFDYLVLALGSTAHA